MDCVIFIYFSLHELECTIDSKIFFIRESRRFCEDNILRYLNLRYVDPAY